MKLVKGGTEAVAKWQKKLGVKEDGAWGKDTQAAFIAQIRKANPNVSIPDNYIVPKGLKLNGFKFPKQDTAPNIEEKQSSKINTTKKEINSDSFGFNKDNKIFGSRFTYNPANILQETAGLLIAGKVLSKGGEMLGKSPQFFKNLFRGVRTLPEKAGGSKIPFKIKLPEMQKFETKVSQPVNYRPEPREALTSSGKIKGLLKGDPKWEKIQEFKNKFRKNNSSLEEPISRKFSDVTPIKRKTQRLLKGDPVWMKQEAKKKAFSDMKKEGMNLKFKKKKI